MELSWEAAYGKAYQIQISANGSTWTPVATVTNSTATSATHLVTGTARYVRMYGTERGTPYGYSLWEFKVFGSSCPTGSPSNPPATTTAPPTPTPPTTTAPTQPPTGSPWAAGTAYAVGAVVTYAAVTYRCRQAHTSIGGWEPPNVPALWQAI